MKAEYYYRHMAYYQAIPYYQQLTTGHTPLPTDWLHLAHCYRYTGQHTLAALAFHNACSSGCSTTDSLAYARTLLQSARYREALSLLPKIDTGTLANQIALTVASCSLSLAQQDSFPSGMVWLLPFNTDCREFAPVVWNNHLTFTADTAVNSRKHKDNWTGTRFCNVYATTITAPGITDSTWRNLLDGKQISSRYHIGPATFTNSAQMFYTRTDTKWSWPYERPQQSLDSTVKLQIAIANNFTPASNSFTNTQLLQLPIGKNSIGHPAINPSGNILVFVSESLSTGNRDLWFAQKSDATWKIVEPIHNLNTPFTEAFPSWANDSTLYFSSDGWPGFGGLDVFQSTWNGDSFTSPIHLPNPINTPSDDLGTGLSPSAAYGYISSDRQADVSGDNIYYYRKVDLYTELTVIDSISLKPLSNFPIKISYDTSVKNVTTSTNGIVFNRLKPGSRYIYSTSNDSFRPADIVVEANPPLDGQSSDTFHVQLKVARWRMPRDTISTINTGITTPTIDRRGIMDSVGFEFYEVDQVYVIGYFDFNFRRFHYRAANKDIDIDKRVVLDTLASILKRHPNMRIRVQAHTDCRGTEEYNMKLSIERAVSVVQYLRRKGINSNRLEYQGFGESSPVIPCPNCNDCTEDDHSENRVLEFRVLSQ